MKLRSPRFTFSALCDNSAQLISLTLKDFVNNRCILWAAALTYTTVFALIPLLAVTFSLFSAFGGLKGLEAEDTTPDSPCAGTRGPRKTYHHNRFVNSTAQRRGNRGSGNSAGISCCNLPSRATRDDIK